MEEEKDFLDGDRYLKETKMLDFSADSIQSLIDLRGWRTLGEVEKVKAIYDFIKDEILFGYNVDDNIPSSRVLADGFGQCNTKGTLFMSLLRAVGIRCRIHGFMIDKILQKGAMTGLVYKLAPKEIFHSYVEVLVLGTWYELEGFILDKKYLSSLQKTFAPNEDGSFIGYGVATTDFSAPQVEFECCNTYIQKEGIVRDFGIFDDPDTLFENYGQKMSAVKKFVYTHFGRLLMNKNVKKIRENNGKTP